jgi:hypothetical protein
MLEKALSHKYVMLNMEVILNPKVLGLEIAFPLSFISMKKGSAGRLHSSSCSEAGCSSMTTLSGLLYKTKSFFIASKV